MSIRKIVQRLCGVVFAYREAYAVLSSDLGVATPKCKDR